MCIRDSTNREKIRGRGRASHIDTDGIWLQKISGVLLAELCKEECLGSEHKSGLDQTTQLLKR